MLSTLGAPRSAQRTRLRQHAKRLTVAGACGNSAAPMFGRCCLTDHAVGPEGFQMGLFCLSRSEFQRWHLSYLKHAPQDMIVEVSEPLQLSACAALHQRSKDGPSLCRLSATPHKIVARLTLQALFQVLA